MFEQLARLWLGKLPTAGTNCMESHAYQIVDDNVLIILWNIVKLYCKYCIVKYLFICSWFQLSHSYIRVEQIGVSDAIGPASYASKYENSKREHEVVKL